MLCTSILKSGKQCSRKIKDGFQFCWQHLESKFDNNNNNTNNTNNALIPDLETIVSEYVDPKTYLNFIKYNPKKYTLGKYEKIIAESLEKEFNTKLSRLESKKSEFESYILDKDNLLGDNLCLILDVMKKLGIVKYEKENVVDYSFGAQSYVSLRLDIQKIPMDINGVGYKKINKKGNLSLSDDLKELIMNIEGSEEQIIILTPLWKLLFENLLVYQELINYQIII